MGARINDYPIHANALYLQQALGFQQLTPTSATGLTVPANATAAVGMVWPVGVPLTYSGDLTAIQFISATGHVNVSYYR